MTSSRQRRENGGRFTTGVASGLLLVLLALFALPFGRGEAQSHVPSCCMDAQHCSMHLHHAAAVHEDAPHVAAVMPHCPCLPLAPAGSASQDVSLLLWVAYGTVQRTQKAGPVRAAPSPSDRKSSADATRGPPERGSKSSRQPDAPLAFPVEPVCSG